MELIIIALLVIAIVLYILSFFKADRVTDLERNIEELSMQHIQDIYQLKRQVRILEEELLTPEQASFAKIHPNPTGEPETKVNEILKNQVISLYQQGLSIEEISVRSTLPHTDIISIIQTN